MMTVAFWAIALLMTAVGALLVLESAMEDPAYEHSDVGLMLVGSGLLMIAILVVARLGGH